MTERTNTASAAQPHVRARGHLALVEWQEAHDAEPNASARNRTTLSGVRALDRLYESGIRLAAGHDLHRCCLPVWPICNQETHMSEESILILNMLREGKITAEQADSLLRAVRDNRVRSPRSTSCGRTRRPRRAARPDPAAMASMQAKLAELQGKLGDLQGKLGAAQTAKAAGQAASFAGKVLDHLPRPDLDMGKINKAVDEAMRGLNSLKNDAVRTAKTAARQASQEARRAAREGRKAMRFEFNMDFGGATSTASSRPMPRVSRRRPRPAETRTWTGADAWLENKYGSVTVIGARRRMARRKRRHEDGLGGDGGRGRVVLQQVFLTHQVENGRCKIGVAAPHDARERLTVDYEIRVPRQTPLEVSTTFGALPHGASSALTAKSASGDDFGETALGGRGQRDTLQRRLRSIRLSGWNVAAGSLLVGDDQRGHSGRAPDRRGSSACPAAAVMSSLQKAQVDRARRLLRRPAAMSVSGRLGAEARLGPDAERVRRSDGPARRAGAGGDGQRRCRDARGVAGTLTVKTVSGDVEASGVESPAVSLLTVSGDAHWAFAGPFSGSFAGTTVSGDLRLELASGSDTRIEMNTTSGSPVLGPAADGEGPLTDKHAAGKMGHGDGSIRLQSVSGD